MCSQQHSFIEEFLPHISQLYGRCLFVRRGCRRQHHHRCPNKSIYGSDVASCGRRLPADGRFPIIHERRHRNAECTAAIACGWPHAVGEFHGPTGLLSFSIIQQPELIDCCHQRMPSAIIHLSSPVFYSFWPPHSKATAAAAMMAIVPSRRAVRIMMRPPPVRATNDCCWLAGWLSLIGICILLFLLCSNCTPSWKHHPFQVIIWRRWSHADITCHYYTHLHFIIIHKKHNCDILSLFCALRNFQTDF